MPALHLSLPVADLDASRFVGSDGEQHTLLVQDPSGNAVEIKAFPQGVWR